MPAIAKPLAASARVAQPAMMARGAPVKKAKVAKKPVKKVVKKPVKKVVKKPVKKVARKPVKRGARGAMDRKGKPIDPAFDPGQVGKALNLGGQVVNNFGGQGIPTAGVIGVGVWILLILRYTIFYGFFGTE